MFPMVMTFKNRFTRFFFGGGWGHASILTDVFFLFKIGYDDELVNFRAKDLVQSMVMQFLVFQAHLTGVYETYLNGLI